MNRWKYDPVKDKINSCKNVFDGFISDIVCKSRGLGLAWIRSAVGQEVRNIFDRNEKYLFVLNEKYLFALTDKCLFTLAKKLLVFTFSTYMYQISFHAT